MRDDDPNDETRHAPSGLLPTDEFTIRLRELMDNPGAVRTSSRVDLQDFYGRHETWTIDTFRTETEKTAFVQRMGSQAPLRLLLPPKVMAALDRQRGTLTGHMRTRGARQAVATRIARGDTLGNRAALEKARKARTAKAKIRKED